PDIGSDEVKVAEVYVKVGDKIHKDDNLLMLETDKATMEVPAEQAGIVTAVMVTAGAKVSQGDVIVKIDAAEKDAQAEAHVTSEITTGNHPSTQAEVESSGQLVPITVPDLSGNSDVAVIEVPIKLGDLIDKDHTLITLETDKATMEVPATVSGVVKDIKVKVGDKVNQGDLIVMVEAKDATATSATRVAQQAKPTPANAPVTQPAPTVTSPEIKINEEAFAKAFASPSIRKLARELGADLAKVKGSGTKGRITEADLKSFVKEVMTGQIAPSSKGAPTNGSSLDLLPWPSVDFAKFGEVEVKPLARIKKISGANLARNWVMIPHVTQFDEADITALEEFRKQLNEEYKKAEIKVTPLAFLIKACVFALKKFPEFNASLNGDNLVYKKYYNLGFAADTPQGLVVPVLKDADKKGIVELANESSALAKLAREGKLKPSDMQGGTFTISSLGGIGGTAFTPIVNAPEVAILGVSKASIKPIWNGKEFAPRLMMPLSLSYDHRIIDGALAAKFTTYLAQILADIRRLVL
ncbi:MAG: dihydrolipoyllysine-residue acetyltransferase, partial [Burkholderiales bacterium]